MLTRLDLISSIQGCSSIRQGVARRLGSFSRLLNLLLAWLAAMGWTI